MHRNEKCPAMPSPGNSNYQKISDDAVLSELLDAVIYILPDKPDGQQTKHLQTGMSEPMAISEIKKSLMQCESMAPVSPTYVPEMPSAYYATSSNQNDQSELFLRPPNYAQLKFQRMQMRKTPYTNNQTIQQQRKQLLYQQEQKWRALQQQKQQQVVIPSNVAAKDLVSTGIHTTQRQASVLNPELSPDQINKQLLEQQQKQLIHQQQQQQFFVPFNTAAQKMGSTGISNTLTQRSGRVPHPQVSPDPNNNQLRQEQRNLLIHQQEHKWRRLFQQQKHQQVSIPSNVAANQMGSMGMPNDSMQLSASVPNPQGYPDRVNNQLLLQQHKQQQNWRLLQQQKQQQVIIPWNVAANQMSSMGIPNVPTQRSASVQNPHVSPGLPDQHNLQTQRMGKPYTPNPQLSSPLGQQNFNQVVSLSPQAHPQTNTQSTVNWQHSQGSLSMQQGPISNAQLGNKLCCNLQCQCQQRYYNEQQRLRENDRQEYIWPYQKFPNQR